MGKFKAHPQLCVISFTLWEITSEGFLLWQGIGTYTIIHANKIRTALSGISEYGNETDYISTLHSIVKMGLFLGE